MKKLTHTERKVLKTTRALALAHRHEVGGKEKRKGGKDFYSRFKATKKEVLALHQPVVLVLSFLLNPTPLTIIVYFRLFGVGFNLVF